VIVFATHHHKIPNISVQNCHTPFNQALIIFISLNIKRQLKLLIKFLQKLGTGTIVAIMCFSSHREK
jgi:hypothetical protein